MDGRVGHPSLPFEIAISDVFTIRGIAKESTDPDRDAKLDRIEAQFGPVRTFVMGGSDHRNHPALARKLQDYLRWRNARARHPGVLAAQRRERARVRSGRQQRWGRPKPKAAYRAGARSWPAH